MNSNITLRILIVLEWILVIVGLTVGSVLESTLPQSLQDWLASDEAPGSLLALFVYPRTPWGDAWLGSTLLFQAMGRLVISDLHSGCRYTARRAGRDRSHFCRDRRILNSCRWCYYRNQLLFWSYPKPTRFENKLSLIG